MASQDTELDAVPPEKEEPMETTWKFFSLSQECASQKSIKNATLTRKGKGWNSGYFLTALEKLSFPLMPPETMKQIIQMEHNNVKNHNW